MNPTANNMELYGGKRTGDADVDKLTVIAHENFDEVIKRTQKPVPLPNKLGSIELDDYELHRAACFFTNSEKVVYLQRQSCVCINECK